MKNPFIFTLLVLISFSCQLISNVKKGDSNSERQYPNSALKSSVNDIVFEGTVISSKSYFVEGMLYTSNVVEVNTIFNGELEGQIVEVFTFGGRIGNLGLSISHGLSLTNTGDLGLFYVSVNSHMSNDSALRVNVNYPIYFLRRSVFNLERDVFSFDSVPHIEKDIYQELEIEFAIKRKVVLHPSTTNILAINHLVEDKLNIPNRDIGLVFKLTPESCHSRNTVAIKIDISSSGRVSYFDHGGIIISYDTSIFGSNVVQNKMLTKNVIHNFKKGNYSRTGGIPSNYQARFKDLTSSSVLMEWYHENNKGDEFQLFAGSRWVLGARLYFKAKKSSGRTTFKINSADSLNLRYDYASKSILPYDYTATTPFIDHALEELFTPEIMEVYPKGPMQVNDTILLKGVNFGMNPELNIYSKCYNGRKELKRVPRSYVIETSDSTIRFILPRVVRTENEVDWIPVSGSIQVSKSLNGIQINGSGNLNIVIEEE